MLRARLLLQRTPFRETRQLARQSRSHAAYLEMPMQSRFRWSYLWYGSILALGITTGLGARHFAAPLGLLEPGSRDDERILASLDSDIDRLDIVQSLRKQSYSLHSDTALTSAGDVKAQKGWLEVDLKWRETDKGRLLHVMSGTRGFGVQRAFWNAETREMVAVVWLGGGLAGWPGVAHGGAIATIFEETMARMVKGPDGPIEPIHRPASLSVTYAKPTYSLDFYVMRASFSKPNLPQTEPPPEPESQPTKSWLSWLSPEKDLTKKTEPQQQAVEIIGTLETVKGDLCVKAKGSFTIAGPLT